MSPPQGVRLFGLPLSPSQGSHLPLCTIDLSSGEDWKRMNFHLNSGNGLGCQVRAGAAHARWKVLWGRNKLGTIMSTTCHYICHSADESRSQQLLLLVFIEQLLLRWLGVYLGQMLPGSWHLIQEWNKVSHRLQSSKETIQSEARVKIRKEGTIKIDKR